MFAILRRTPLPTLVGLLLVPMNVLSPSSGQAAPDGLDPEQFSPAGRQAEQALQEFDAFYQEHYFSKGHSPGNMSGTGYLPYQRSRWFYEQNRNHRGEVDPQRRWAAYLRSREMALGQSGKRMAAAWESWGPDTLNDLGGRILSHAFHPNDSQVLFVGSNGGGLWKTVDGGAQWFPLTDQIPSLRISSIAINPQDPDQILIGTGSGWANTLNLKPGVGVLRSTDGGLTFQPTNFSYPFNESAGVSTYDLVWDPTDGSRIHLAATNGTWLSTDGGLNWILRISGETSALVLNKSAPQTVYAAVQGDGIYRSTNSGQSYTRLSNGLPNGTVMAQTSLTICDGSPDVLYTAIAHSTTLGLEGLYRTNDGGDTWMKLNGTPNFMCQPGQSTGCVGWLFNAIQVSPVDPDLLLVGGVQAWRTENGGQSWTWHDYLSNGIGVNNDGLTYVDHFAFGFDPSDDTTVYAFNDGGVFKSTDSGQWWDPACTGLVTSMIYRVASFSGDGNQLVAGFQDHGLQRLDHTGGNTRWTRWTTNDGCAVNWDHDNVNIIYGDLQNGNHVKSFSSGTFAAQPIGINAGIMESGPFISPTVIHPTDDLTLYTASTSRIYKTTNGGTNWSVSANAANVMTIGLDRVNPDIVYAHAYTSSSWTIWRSFNAGASWAPINHSTIPTWRVTDLEACPFTSGVVYATRNSAFPNSDHVKKSFDFGATWTNITGNLPDIFTYAIAISPFNADHLYLATELGVFVSTNAGGSWQQWNDGLPFVYAHDIHYHEATRTIRLATLGRGVWVSPAMDALPTAVGPPQTAAFFRIQSVGPTPFGSSVTLRYELLRDLPVSVAVFNTMGQRIQDLGWAQVGVGLQSVTWDGRDARGVTVASGPYFVQISAGGVAETRRVLLVR